jgi:hypothetical protein
METTTRIAMVRRPEHDYLGWRVQECEGGSKRWFATSVHAFGAINAATLPELRKRIWEWWHPEMVVTTK